MTLAIAPPQSPWLDRCRMAPRWYAVWAIAPIAKPSESSSHWVRVSTATTSRIYARHDTEHLRLAYTKYAARLAGMLPAPA